MAHPVTRPDTTDRPIPAAGTSPVTNTNGACTCKGVTGTRTVHTLGQPGCHHS